jgi:hypothetical protein
MCTSCLQDTCHFVECVQYLNENTKSYHNNKNNIYLYMTRTIQLVFVLIEINMTGATSGAGTAYSSGAPEFLN